MALTKTSYSMLAGAPAVNVKDFGAVGDFDLNTKVGTDDTAAIQAALDSIPAQGGSVFIPRGNYRITAPLRMKTRTTVEGESRNHTFLCADAAMDYILGWVSTGSSAYNLRIRHLGVEGLGRTDVLHGIKIDGDATFIGGAAHLIIEDVSAGTCTNGKGLYIRNHFFAFIENFYSANCEYGTYYDALRSSRIVAGVLYDHSEANFYYLRCSQLAVERVECYNQDVPGTYIGVLDTSTACRLTHCTFEPVLLNGVGSVDYSLYMRRSDLTPGVNCTDNTIDACDFIGAPGTQIYAMKIGDTGQQIFKTIVNNCRFLTNNAQPDIRIEGDSRDTLIQSCIRMGDYSAQAYQDVVISSTSVNPFFIRNTRVPFTNGKNLAVENLAMGIGCLPNTQPGGVNLIAIGYNAGSSMGPNQNCIAIGTGAQENNINANECVAVGVQALNNVTVGGNNVGIGHQAGSEITDGGNNTALGYRALRLDQSGNPMTSFGNCAGLGSGAAVSGNDQVQLGNSATTTYAYGAVQNRSDIRDKADVRDTVLGLDFITKLRAVDFKWDYRDDYFEEYEHDTGLTYSDGTPIIEKRIRSIPKDGSKKRTRYHHGLIAQEVKAVLDDAGVDFGGFQNHSVKGGNDVMSIGYNELIAPLIKAVQELAAKVAALESKS